MDRTTVRLGAALLGLVVLIVAVAFLLELGRARPVAATGMNAEHLAQLPRPELRARLPEWQVPDASGQWTAQLGDPASSRYSPMAEINVANVGRLKPVFSF